MKRTKPSTTSPLILRCVLHHSTVATLCNIRQRYKQSDNQTTTIDTGRRSAWSLCTMPGPSRMLHVAPIGSSAAVVVPGRSVWREICDVMESFQPTWRWEMLHMPDGKRTVSNSKKTRSSWNGWQGNRDGLGDCLCSNFFVAHGWVARIGDRNAEVETLCCDAINSFVGKHQRADIEWRFATYTRAEINPVCDSRAFRTRGINMLGIDLEPASEIGCGEQNNSENHCYATYLSL